MAQRLRFLLATVVVPALSFWLAWAGVTLPEWQSGELKAWAGILIGPPGATYFSPFAGLVAITCLAIVLRPRDWVHRSVVRWILMLGLVLSLHYGFLVLLFITESWWKSAVFLLGLWLLGRALIWLGRWIRDRSSRRLRWWLSGGLVILAWLGGTIFQWIERSHPPAPGEALTTGALVVLWSALMLCLLCGPVWSLQALLGLHRRLGKLDGFRWWGLGLLAPLYLVSWRLAALEAMRFYQSLPDSPPDCFLATAAGRGPGWLVGGREVRCAGGGSFRVTPQLARFKAAELLLRRALPRGHQRLRALYDRCGPRWAKRVSTPPRAALVWLLLKPAEWAVAAVLITLTGWDHRGAKGR
ncbi:MAG: DUF6688 family protein [Acidobacteriota bacterium]